MGIHVIKMPDIGEGIAEVEVASWHVKPGDVVAEDQALADVMTDKAAVEIPSPVAGRVLALGGKAGDVLAVGAELLRLEVHGEGNVADAAVVTLTAAMEPQPNETQPSAPAAPASSAPEPAAGSKAPTPTAADRAAAFAVPRRAPNEKPIASPAVRRRAWDTGIELRFVAGSGPAGRILNGDLDGYAAGSGVAAPDAGPSSLHERHDTQQIQVIGLRRKIAEKMQESKRRIPHFAYVEEVDVTDLEKLRTHMNETRRSDQPKLTILPFVMRAVVRALAEYPQVNARFDDEAGIVTRYGAVHLGVATQTKNGLVVPVVKHAEACDLWRCASEVARLANAARDGKASRDELSGSTLSITSLGAMGGIVTTPVINHPEVAIVGINKIVERPIFVGSTVVARKLMNLSSSFDHRVVDGWDAAEFIQKVRAYLEFPATLFIEAA
jgi:2-oxoisovalerate dehydrogenase E2 component (dihydrolipoyl transacylase)